MDERPDSLTMNGESQKARVGAERVLGFCRQTSPQLFLAIVLFLFLVLVLVPFVRLASSTRA
jgi:hypothetical protein